MKRRWELWGGLDLGCGIFLAVHTHEQAVRMSGQCPIEVVAVEDPDGRYWGWIRTGEDEPTIIQPHQSSFEVCFPYGVQAEVKAGHGEVVRLDIGPKLPEWLPFESEYHMAEVLVSSRGMDNDCVRVLQRLMRAAGQEKNPKEDLWYFRWEKVNQTLAPLLELHSPVQEISNG